MQAVSIIQQAIGGLVLCVALFASPNIALGKDSPAPAATVEKLQDQMRALDKDAAVFSEKTTTRLDAQDKRIADLGLTTAQQANQIAVMANQTATVGNYIANTSIGITFIVFFAGLITYVSAKSRAEKEAREASKQWFAENAGQLKKDIDEKYRKLQTDLDSFSKQLTAHAIEAEAAKKKLLTEISNQLVNPSTSQPQTLDIKSAASLNEIVETTKDKPESTFTAADYFARGLSALADKKFESALTAFENALQRLASDAPASDVARYLIFKAIALSESGKLDQAIDDCEAIDQRFGNDPTPDVREQVARAINNKGVALGLLDRLDEALVTLDSVDKRFWREDAPPGLRERVANALYNKGVMLGRSRPAAEEIAAYDAVVKRFANDEAPGVRENVAKALFNKAVTLGHSGLVAEGIAVVDDIEKRFGQDDWPSMRELVAEALNNKGAALVELGKSDEAFKVFDALINRFRNDTTPSVLAQVSLADKEIQALKQKTRSNGGNVQEKRS